MTTRTTPLTGKDLIKRLEQKEKVRRRRRMIEEKRLKEGKNVTE